MISLDFETYSEAGYAVELDIHGKLKVFGEGLRGVGSPAYAEHHTAEVVTCSYDLGDGIKQRWNPKLAPPRDLFEAINSGQVVNAFNASFEFYIWNMVCVKKYGWAPIQLNQLSCTAARALAYGLPPSLKGACEALGINNKDERGVKFIDLFCLPKTPTKSRALIRYTQNSDPEGFKVGEEYCDRDVAVERELSQRIPELSLFEREVWLADQTINIRGVQVDTVTLKAAMQAVEDHAAKLDVQFEAITGIKKTTETKNFKDWLNAQGVSVMSVSKHVLENILLSDSLHRSQLEDAFAKTDYFLEATPVNPNGIIKALMPRHQPFILPDHVRKAIQIRLLAGSAAVLKLKAIERRISSDGRLRNEYRYCGAARTGRWGAHGVQLQNLKAEKGLDAAQIDRLIERTTRGDFDDDVNKQVGSIIRSLFVAKEGHTLLCCDFSSIEAVVAAYLSGCQWRIDVFETHRKMYELSASKITGTDFNEMIEYKNRTGEHHPDRVIGKVAELAAGFGSGIKGWKAFGADKHFESDDAIQRAVKAWRAESPEIVQMWYALGNAAKNAICCPGQYYQVGQMAFFMKDGVLCLQLPSDRVLYYHEAKIVDGQISHMGYNSNPAKGAVGWIRMEKWGGALFHNVVQATARDLQANAMVNCERSGYPIVMHTHDELVAEVPQQSNKSVEQMISVIESMPDWCKNWIIRVDGFQSQRYRK